MNAIERELQRGLALHAKGQLAEAAKAYRGVLQAQPDNADALNLLSVVFHTEGNQDLAAQLARLAIASQPDFFAPYINLGAALQAMGQTAEAVEAFQKAIALHPQSPEAYSNLCNALHALGRDAEAVEAGVAAIGLRRDMPEAYNNLGNALLALKRATEAEDAYRKACRLNPVYGAAIFNLGNALFEQGRHEEALERFRRAVQIDPNMADRHYNLGNALAAMGRSEEAAMSLRTAIAKDPSHISARNNLASALKDLERPAEAEACLREALALAPDAVDLHWNLSLVLLQQGKWEEGWREYEWRWRTPTFQDFRRDFGKPRWQGESFAGKTLLVHAEQGFGDGIQFARLLPLVAARGGRVILECRKPLKRLFGSLAGPAELAGLGDPLPDFDLEAPLMSLPDILRLRPETLPVSIPYLSPPEGESAFADIAALPGLKVGFVWAGGAVRRDNQQRSIPPSLFAPLLDIPNLRLFSLQVGDLAPELAQIPARDNLVDLAPRLSDFADTAAAISALDLVISVDTGVVHLAGALGKPVWVLLSRPTNGFLWMLEREDSLWYPTARLFRQKARADWPGLMTRVRDALIQRVGNQSAG